MQGLISDEQFADVKRVMLADIVARRREQEAKGLGPAVGTSEGGNGLKKRCSRGAMGVSLDSVSGPSAAEKQRKLEEKHRVKERAKHFSALVKAANARTLQQQQINESSHATGKANAKPSLASPPPIETKDDDHEFANLEDVFADEATRVRKREEREQRLIEEEKRNNLAPVPLHNLILPLYALHPNQPPHPTINRPCRSHGSSKPHRCPWRKLARSGRCDRRH